MAGGSVPQGGAGDLAHARAHEATERNGNPPPHAQLPAPPAPLQDASKSRAPKRTDADGAAHEQCGGSSRMTPSSKRRKRQATRASPNARDHDHDDERLAQTLRQARLVHNSTRACQNGWAHTCTRTRQHARTLAELRRAWPQGRAVRGVTACRHRRRHRRHRRHRRRRHRRRGLTLQSPLCFAQVRADQCGRGLFLSVGGHRRWGRQDHSPNAARPRGRQSHTGPFLGAPSRAPGLSAGVFVFAPVHHAGATQGKAADLRVQGRVADVCVGRLDPNAVDGRRPGRGRPDHRRERRLAACAAARPDAAPQALPPRGKSQRHGRGRGQPQAIRST